MIRQLGFFISEAITGMRRSGLMVLLTVATITVSLIVFGIFLLLSFNIHHFAKFMSSRLEIRVFLKEEMTKPEKATFHQLLAGFPDVKRVEYIEKDEAWQTFQKVYPDMNLDELFDHNPLPDSFCIFLSDNHHIAELAKKIRGYDQYVEDVVYGDKVAERIEFFANFSRYFGLVLVGLLTVATFFIMVNTIRLTVIARQKEIVIMQLVGATSNFIRLPFIFEGLFIGILGSVFAVCFLIFGYSFLLDYIQQKLPYFPLVQDNAMLFYVYAGVVFLGTILGVLGAYLSVSKSLKHTI